MRFVDVEAEGGHVFLDVFRGLFEGHEDAGLVVFHGAVDEEFDAHQGLAAAGGAADECGAAAGEAAAGDVVEAFDAGGGFGEGFGFCEVEALGHFRIAPREIGREREGTRGA